MLTLQGVALIAELFAAIWLAIATLALIIAALVVIEAST
jgi:hypothetical protein